MQALDNIRDYKLNSNVEDHMEYTLDEYKEYLKKIEGLSPLKREGFLDVIKNNEVINNQEMELEDPFLIQLGLSAGTGLKRTSIDIMVESILANQPLTAKKLYQLHRTLIKGTNDDIEKNHRIRDFDIRVSEVSNGNERVQYIPPAPDEVKPYINDMIRFLEESEENERNLFLNSIIVHFYIAALQPFGNGNTRLARLIEHGSIFKLSRDVLGSKIKLPALYMSESHLNSRMNYRENIARLVTEPTDEMFNRWVDYNLNMVDEQLYRNGNAIELTYY